MRCLIQLRATMRTLIQRAERSIVRRYEFICNVHYYTDRGHTLRNAILLARDTI